MLNAGGFAILGAGLIGTKRAEALAEAGIGVEAVADVSLEKAQALAQKVGATVATSLDEMLKNARVQNILVATSNDAAAGAVAQSLKAGKHVLVEKPAGRNPFEILEWVKVSESVNQLCRVGFNHRFHPALQKAKTMLSEGAIGDFMYIRARYGHGGRAGYDREWRADPKKSGGGELLDQGVHLIDLCRWFAGEFELAFGSTPTYFWDMPVEDNGFLFLQSPTDKKSAWLHASCTEWKNIFDFELFGKSGKLQIVGLGRSYGVEQLHHFRRPPQGGVPDCESLSFPEADRSWSAEIHSFLQELSGRKSTDLGRPRDALRAVEIVYEAYRQSSRLPSGSSI